MRAGFAVDKQGVCIAAVAYVVLCFLRKYLQMKAVVLSFFEKHILIEIIAFEQHIEMFFNTPPVK